MSTHEPGDPSSTTGTVGSAVERIRAVMDQWIRDRDVVRAQLDCTSLNDTSLATLVQILSQCPSLEHLDVSYNDISMASYSDICLLLSMGRAIRTVSLEGCHLPLRAIGYFMTALMERGSKDLPDFDKLSFTRTGGIISTALEAKKPGKPSSWILNHRERITQAIGRPCTIVAATVLHRASVELWRFMADTGHPQVSRIMEEQEGLRSSRSGDDDLPVGDALSPEAQPQWEKLESSTLERMKQALEKIVLFGPSGIPGYPGTEDETFTAAMAILPAAKGESLDRSLEESKVDEAAKENSSRVEDGRKLAANASVGYLASAGAALKAQKTALAKRELAKCQTFNLKQIITRNGTVLMNVLERMLETTSINAKDAETGYTLLEYACRTHNMGLAKLCYRRGAPLEAKMDSGDTPFTIATRQRDYRMMEFLYTYGVRINSKDAEGKAALHVATACNDVDAICRLIEWGADVNLRDNRQRTPLHFAAAGGHIKVTMLLLELGADLNAEDSKEYTAVAHAEANDHFQLMDRLISLGGRGHRLHEIGGQVPAPPKRKTTREQLMEKEAMGIDTNPKRKNSIISPLYNPPVKKEMNKFAALQAKDDLEAKQMAKLAAKKLAMEWT
ncbi:hypothetical protein FOZ61_002480 [Perkinsus olseni]|uniref:Ankyrin repeat protein n=2 Tax=Perkinsus olseni TaxID=32597 RepID=A0A7J6MVV1_PEROL|nr:hypothetical protein FOZ61_002480 [Perkinsus olseni]KAF4675566.1 hypothetical protein FOL46_001093 [Perkinsus olseni]